ncbi:MAG: hypothetical protein CMF96_06050 [Candidatus Marinimicrobia bacterium]|nr:hypothetical protein [Candidatus Neomarinimicrobiota bacterium]
MTKIKNIRNRLLKYIGFSLILIFTIFILTFLLNPIMFIKDIESGITDLVETESGMKLEYLNFSGNFFKGFTLESPTLTLNSNIISNIKILNVYPGLITSFFSKKLRLNKLKLIDGDLNIDNFIIKNNSKKNTEIYIKLLELEDIVILINNQKYKLNSKFEIEIGQDSWIKFISGICELPIWPFEIELDKGEIKQSNTHYYMNDLKINSNFGQIEINGDFNKENFLNSFINLRLNKLKLDYFFNNSINLDNLSVMFETISSDSSIAKLNGTAKIDNIEIDNYQIDLGLTKNTIYVNSSNFIFENSNIDVNGIYDLKSKKLDLLSNLHNIKLPLDYQNNLNGEMKLFGSINSDSLKIDLNLYNSSIYNHSIDELNGKFLYKNDSLQSIKLISINNDDFNFSLDKFTYNFKNNLVETNGEFHFNNFNFSAKYLDSYQEIILNGMFNGEINRNEELLSILGNAKINNSKLGNNIIESSSFKLDYLKNKSNLSISLNGNTKLEKFDYDRYLKLDSLSFSIMKNNNKAYIYFLNGYHNKFAKLLAKDIKLYENKFSSEEIFINYNEVNILSEKILAHKKNDLWNIKNHPLYLNKDQINFNSNFKDFKEFDISASSDDLNFSSINAILNIPQRLLGQFSGIFNYSKLLDRFEIITEAKMVNGNFDEITFDSLAYNINWNNDKISYNDISYFNGNQILKIYGEHFPNENIEQKYRYGDIFLTGYANKFDLFNLNNFIPISIDIGGFYTGNFEIKGSPDSPVVEMDVNIDKPRFDLITGQYLSGKIYYNNELSHIENLEFETINGYYNGEGYIPLSLNIFGRKSNYYNNQNLDFSFNGQTTSFEFLTPYFEIIDSINGQINFNMDVSGSLSSPIRNGNIEIKQAKLNLMPLKNTIYGINGHAVIKDNILTINKLTGLTGQITQSNVIDKVSSFFRTFFSNNNTDNNNQIYSNGEIELSDFFNPEFNIFIFSNDLYLSSINETFSGNAVTSFKITGKDTIFINGKFEPIANQFTFLMEFEDSDGLNSERISKGKVLAYDIQIPLDNGVKIENSQMDGLIDGNINLSATGDEPFTFSGNINVVDGSFYFNGNTIDQISGNILLDPAEIEPIIDFRGITNVAGKDIELSLNGKMDNPNLSLESISDPELTQDDLLYLLVFTPDSLSQSDGVIGTEQVGNLITNYVENTLERNIVRNSLLDKFQFNTQGGTLLSGFENSHLNLYLGKNISPNLYLNLQSDLNAENSTIQYEVGYRLSRNMSIVGRIDEKQLYHLTYRFKYKY